MGRPGTETAREATSAYLERVALNYQERHAGSEARLRRVLRDRVRRSRAAHGTPSEEAGAELIDALVAKMCRLGYVDDSRVAGARARSMRARGKSARAIRAALAGLGIDEALIEAALLESDDLEAARTYVRRRRLGGGEKDLAKLARAGFSYDVARRAFEER